MNGEDLILVREDNYTATAPQLSMTLEGTPTSVPGSTTIVYANQKTAGPKIYGALAIMLGSLGALMQFFGFLDAGNQAELWGASDNPLRFWLFIFPIIGFASSVVFVYAGTLLFNYKRRGVWVGFGAVGVNALGTAIHSFVIGKIIDESAEGTVVEGVGGLFAGAGIFVAAVSAVCCGLIVALPLLINGNDLED
ncbi:MAG: hypothetical protein CMA88_01790 [Euryarchaeota archaeon]|nr:hypothetical protein [Euryarchaeota archaeon]